MYELVCQRIVLIRIELFNRIFEAKGAGNFLTQEGNCAMVHWFCWELPAVSSEGGGSPGSDHSGQLSWCS